MWLRLTLVGFFLSWAMAQVLPEGHPPNILPEVYDCNNHITVIFNGSEINCGTPLPLATTQVQPTIYFKDADPGMLYTVIMVDRDALSMSSPAYSPVVHFIVSNVTATDLRNGFNTSSMHSLKPFFSYSPPAPFVGTGCHRYYFILYAQSSQVFPTMDVIPADAILQRINWNFPQWAANQSLTKLGVNFFLTQDPRNSTGPCQLPASCPPPPREICCTHILSSTATSFAVSLPFRAALSSLTLWVDSPSPPAGAPPPAADPLAGLGISIGSSDVMTGCAVSTPAAGAGAVAALPDYRTAVITCGAAGPRIGFSVPTTLRPGAAAGPVVTKVCVVNATNQAEVQDAVLSFKF